MSLRETPSVFFFFNDTATTEIYTLSLHDALPISRGARGLGPALRRRDRAREADPRAGGARRRLERRGGRAPRRERPGRRCRPPPRAAAPRHAAGCRRGLPPERRARGGPLGARRGRFTPSPPARPPPPRPPAPPCR